MPKQRDEALSAVQAGRYLECSESYIRWLVKQGRLPEVPKRGPGDTLRVLRSELDRFRGEEPD